MGIQVLLSSLMVWLYTGHACYPRWLIKDLLQKASWIHTGLSKGELSADDERALLQNPKGLLYDSSIRACQRPPKSIPNVLWDAYWHLKYHWVCQERQIHNQNKYLFYKALSFSIKKWSNVVYLPCLVGCPREWCDIGGSVFLSTVRRSGIYQQLRPDQPWWVEVHIANPMQNLHLCYHGHFFMGLLGNYRDGPLTPSKAKSGPPRGNLPISSMVSPLFLEGYLLRSPTTSKIHSGYRQSSTLVYSRKKVSPPYFQIWTTPKCGS